LELIKDYDMSLQYHPGKANVVADALSCKSYVNGLTVGELPEDLIRITPVILEFCPDLSQRVNPDKYSSNHTKNAT
jgi:hypothetical protein